MDSITGTPSDPTLTYTPLELGGKTYQLLFNLTALAKAQKATGINFLHGIDFDELDAEKYAALVHAGIGKMHPDVTLDQVSELVSMRNFRKVAAAVAEAFGANAAAEENPTRPTPPE